MGIAQDFGGGGGGGGANNPAKCFLGGGWGVVAKPCDYCNSAAALLFCRADSAFMCMACDSKLHAPNKLGSKHERVWMCEVCEQAPASVTCKADAAALCVSCDHDIHSANPLAQRHERVPVVPFYETAESVVKSSAISLLVPADKDSAATGGSDHGSKLAACGGHDGYNFNDPWISTNSKLASDHAPDHMKSVEFLFSDTDNFLDFDYSLSAETQFQQHYNSGSDSVVPVQTLKTPPPPAAAKVTNNFEQKHFEIDFTKSNINSYNNNFNVVPTLSHSISSSSLDVGVVPDGSSMSDMSYSFGRSMGSSMDLSGSGSGSQASQLTGMDREARVLRYREKRKNRKFEKTIRYASRKAYAETRPRIKGRFAKRTEADSDIDQIFSNDFMNDVRYGVVPTF